MAKTIKDASVLLVGVGRLGSAIAVLLCKRGVKRLVLCDYDIVMAENPTEQPLYEESDVGRRKVDAAKERLRTLNPATIIETIPEPFSANIPLAGIDLIIDGTDNLETRMLQNDVAKKTGVPLVIATASMDKGMVFVVRKSEDGDSAPCWQCVMRGKIAVDDCASGIRPLTIAHVMREQERAIERTLEGNAPEGLAIIDGSDGSVTRVDVKRNPACEACDGVYGYLRAPFELHFCASRAKMIARPNTPKAIDIDAIRKKHEVLRDYGDAVQVRLDGGTVLVHRHGLLEFSGVDEETARRFAADALK